MPRQIKRVVEKKDFKGWLLSATLAFCIAASTISLIRSFGSQELSCRIKIADPVTGIIVLQCEK